jgi:CRISPR-associated protein Cmr2
MEKFNSCFDEKNKVFPNYDASNLYGTTHSLVQGLLAVGKTKPTSIKPIQEGEKCPLCGEHEVLNNSKTDIKAAEYNKNVTQFWDKLRKVLNPENSNSQIGKNERLCAVCILKRLLPLKNVFKDDKHILYKTLVKSYDENFPSTTEMSAWEFLKTLPTDKRKSVVEQLHSNEFDSDDEKLKSILDGSKGYETKYYAFLLMDGDKMGNLINGESIETSWNDVINIRNRASTVFAKEDFAKQKRTINPALHSMISDSLNNFARYGVQPIISQCEGKLIYAGGDDVCAILPLSTAFKAADEIRQVYQYSFAKVTSEGSKQIESVDADTKKIVVHLGHSNKQDETKISLSGAIIIAHHKTPLKEVITQAHAVLDGVAKEKSGRNSLAIRLDKRSGGSRDTWLKWEDKNVFSNDANLTCKTSFEEIIKIAQKKELSTSLLYKIESLKASIEPLADDIEKNKDLIIKLFEYEIAHSGYKTEANKMAVHLAGLCVKHSKMSDTDDSWYNPEVAIIANFMAKSGIKIEEGEKNDE